jgi:hypothetical protein
MENKKEVILSASRIKTLETCSWSYWCSYHLKLPQKENSGAMRGTICHLIFECLLNERHKKHFHAIMESGSVSESEPIKRLIKKHCKKKNLNDEDYKMINDMILVGLSQDFYCKDSVLGKPELEFIIENENPKYKIKGFIDKNSVSNDGNSVKIIDYKSSKAKFKGEELLSNFQAMTYSLACFKKIFPNAKKVVTQFIFLRFPKSCIQEIEIPKEQLGGFEYYLSHIFKKANTFTEKDAESNFASDNDESKWLCKAGKTWKCPYLEAFDYYSLLDSNGKVLSSSFENNFNPEKGQRVIKATYSGCPAHAREKHVSRSSAFDLSEF